jgi:hypothetical protein
MASPGELAEQRRGVIPRHASGVDSFFTWAPANFSALNAPIGGTGAEATSP